MEEILISKNNIQPKALWLRSNQFHSHLWDSLDNNEPYYPMQEKRKWIKRKQNYTFKENKRHMHLSNLK